MKLVVISNEETMYSVCESISRKYPGLLKKREAPVSMSPREQKLSFFLAPTSQISTQIFSHGTKLGGTLFRIERLVDSIIEVDRGSMIFAPELLLKFGRNLIKVDSTASLSDFMLEE